jgi:hypothetical protein
MKILLSGAVREREILNHTHVFISHRCGLTPLPLCDTVLMSKNGCAQLGSTALGHSRLSHDRTVNANTRRNMEIYNG